MKPIYKHDSYEELLIDLKKKYGVPSDSYFHNCVSYSPRQSIKRSAEGLLIHHDREDTAIMLSHAEFNKRFKYPFEWHNPENLTYCNMLEHLMLHILICCRKKGVLNERLQQETGSGGVVNFMAPQVNTYLSGAYEYKMPWILNALAMFDDKENVEDYYLCLEYMVKNYNGVSYKGKKVLALVLSSPDKMVVFDKKKYEPFFKALFKRLYEC